MIEILVTVASAIASYLVMEGVSDSIVWINKKMRSKKIEKKAGMWLKTLPLTDEDKELIKRNREIMQDFFPKGIAARMNYMTLEERIALTNELLERIAKVYGLNIEKVIYSSSSEIGECTFGAYDYQTNSIALNLDLLGNKSAEAQQILITTIFHEFRHALQYKAITDSNFKYGTEEQLKLWALNFTEGHYIQPEIDFALYQRQIVEADARQIAEESTEGY